MDTLMVENRIYVLVPHQIELMSGRRMKLPCGMLTAQGIHTARKMQEYCKLKYKDTTTIVLGARDQKEMVHVAKLLDLNKLKYSVFEDTNIGFYGSPEGVLTCLVVEPIHPDRIQGILDHLPLYSCQCEAKA